ncbi:lipopolysaccharide biosynthesis protein [Dyella ginsengisoli]|uniref:Lipopolysaccharide biosynthesis protein n=1 Tax=Dyella ginsengisoli TaxID=363848 RepID=A0ABW8JQR9_9GAMM
MQFVVMVVLARLLSPADFGLIAILLALTTIGTLLVDSGFGVALVQRQHTTADDETTVFIFTVGASILAAGILMLAAPAIASFFHEPRLVDLTRVMALVLPLGAFASVPDALLTMRLDFRARARAEVVASLCSGAVAVVLALHGFNVWSLAWQSIVSIGVRGLLLWLYSGWRPRGRYRGASFRSLFGFGGYMLFTGLLNAAAIRLQSLLIGKLFDASALGFYTLAQGTQQAPASLIDGILKRVGLPVFSTIAQDKARLRSAFRASLRMAMFLFVPCMVGIAVVARPLIEFIYGARWSPAAPILSILSLSAALWPIHVLNLAAIGAQGRSNLLLRVEVIKQVMGILLIATASPWGPLAIAWAVLFSGFFGVVINAYYSKKLLNYGAFAQLLDQSATFALSLVAALVGWMILQRAPPGPASMLSAIAAAAVAYGTLAALTRNIALNGLLTIVRTLREKSDTSIS